MGDLERLASVLATPTLGTGPVAAEFEATICSLVALMRASGATIDQITARLTRLVRCATAHDTPRQEMERRTAAVVAWCERSFADAPTADRQRE